MPTINPSYYAVLIDGLSKIRVIDYDMDTRVWSLLSDRLDIRGEELFFDGLSVLTATPDGEVQCNSLSYRLVSDSPRLDFYRQVDSVPRFFASLTLGGKLVVIDVNESLKTGTDRMFLPDSLASIGLDGLFAAVFTETDIEDLMLEDGVVDLMDTEDLMDQVDLMTSVGSEDLLTEGDEQDLMTDPRDDFLDDDDVQDLMVDEVEDLMLE